MRILLIDDDKDDQALFREAIKQIAADIVCEVADDGLQAFQKLNASETLPEITFLDINMPLMDGRETIRLIRSTPKLRHMRVVIYSTSGAEKEVAWFREMGAGYVVKPNTFQTLVQVLRDELRATLKLETNNESIRGTC
jgi:CheY-like chemotaxis protein